MCEKDTAGQATRGEGRLGLCAEEQSARPSESSVRGVFGFTGQKRFFGNPSCQKTVPAVPVGQRRIPYPLRVPGNLGAFAGAYKPCKAAEFECTPTHPNGDVLLTRPVRTRKEDVALWLCGRSILDLG